MKVKDFKEYKILRYDYPFSSDELEVMVLDMMNDQEKRWVVKLTMEGINDTGGDENNSWDLFFADEKLENKIEEVIIKYEVPFQRTDQTYLLLKDPSEFSESFIKKLNEFLGKYLSIDDILDNILDVGIENISIFERYYLDRNTEINQENGEN